jgi:hypothetical protein
MAIKNKSATYNCKKFSYFSLDLFYFLFQKYLYWHPFGKKKRKQEEKLIEENEKHK